MARIRIPDGKTDGKYRYKEVIFSTDVSLLESQWDKVKQKAKGKTDKETIANQILTQIKNDFDEIVLTCKVNGLDLYSELIKRLNPQPVANEKPQILPIAWMRGFLERKKKDLSQNTIAGYKTMVSKLEDYQTKRNNVLHWDSFDYAFFDALPQFLIEYHDLTNNSIKRTISNIKTLLNYAEKEGVSLNPYYKKVSTARFNTQTTDIALTKDELTALYNFDLSNNPRYEKTRDLFCFMCFTGLRVSDLKQFKPEHIKVNADGGQYIDLTMEKTKHKIIVSLNAHALELLQKYDYTFNVKSEQRLNDEIKVVAEMTGAFDTLIEKVMMQGTQKITQTLPKWQMIKNHTARRTFATILAVELGVPVYDISKLLGHGDVQTTQKYLKENEQAILRNSTLHLGKFQLG